MKNETNFELKRVLINRTFAKFKNIPISLTKLSKIINLSCKQTKRLWKQFNENNNLIINHKHKHRLSNKSKDCSHFINEYKDESLKINAFRGDDSFRVSFSKFYNSHESIKSFCTLRTLNTKFTQALIYSPVAYRSTKRKINKQIKEQSNLVAKKEIEVINQLQIFKEVKPYKAKDYAFGEIIELDACQHRWINANKYYIYMLLMLKLEWFQLFM